MEPEGVRRAVLSIPHPGGSVRVDILHSGHVRLRVPAASGPRDQLCDTLEEVFVLAAADPGLDGEVYEALVWELDLLGLRGQKGDR